jgi:DNA-3-methyladenine glycosylase II
MKFELRPRPPYDLARCAWVFSQFPSDGADVWFPAKEGLPAYYVRLHVLEGEAILAIVHQQNEKQKAKPRLLVQSYPARAKHPSVLRARVSWQFHLDAPLGQFYRRAAKHPLFHPILRSLYGVKPLRPPSLYEMAVIAITEQQLAYNVAVKMRARLVDALGKKMVWAGKEYRAFPTAQALAECKVNDLRALSFSTRKAEYLINLSRRVALDGMNLEELRDRPNEEVIAVLTSLRGLGRWSAEYLLTRGLGRSDVFAADDLGVQTLVGKYLGPGRRLSAEECRKILKPWEAYQRWVVFYLFCASRLGLLSP